MQWTAIPAVVVVAVLLVPLWPPVFFMVLMTTALPDSFFYSPMWSLGKRSGLCHGDSRWHLDRLCTQRADSSCEIYHSHGQLLVGVALHLKLAFNTSQHALYAFQFLQHTTTAFTWCLAWRGWRWWWWGGNGLIPLELSTLLNSWEAVHDCWRCCRVVDPRWCMLLWPWGVKPCRRHVRGVRSWYVLRCLHHIIKEI